MNPLEDLAEAAELMGKLLADLQPEHAGLSTPCTAWTVHDLVDHICVNPCSFLTWAGADAQQPAPGPAARRHAEVIERALSAYSAPDALTRLLPTPFGDLPGGPVLAVCFADQLTHVWDLARALDRAVDVPDALAERAIEVWSGFITDQLRNGVTFAAPTQVSPSASALDRLAALTGRTI